MDDLDKDSLIKTKRRYFEEVVEPFLNGELTVREFLDSAFELASLPFPLYIDASVDNVDFVENLQANGYRTEIISDVLLDSEIREKFSKREYDGIFITGDSDFQFEEVPDPFRRGIVQIPKGEEKLNPEELADEIKSRIQSAPTDDKGLKKPVTISISKDDVL